MHRRWGWWWFALIVGCGTSSAISGPSDSGASDDGSVRNDAGIVGDGNAASAIGAPCVPSFETSATFGGFRSEDVTLDESNPACGSAVCLVNHFQGRVTCPYGQDPSGNGPGDAGGCTVPGNPAEKVSGDVNPQCTDREANKTVYCSCRCANADGKTDDGATYCACPTGMSCTQTVPEFVAGDPNAGGYCTIDATMYDPSSACANECDPIVATCAAAGSQDSEATSTPQRRIPSAGFERARSARVFPSHFPRMDRKQAVRCSHFSPWAIHARATPACPTLRPTSRPRCEAARTASLERRRFV